MELMLREFIFFGLIILGVKELFGFHLPWSTNEAY
jgi:hypothetical protein